MATVTIYPSAAAWNSYSWDKTTGGPIDFSFDVDASSVIQDRVADDDWPTFVAAIDKTMSASLTLRDVKAAIGAIPGDKSNLTLTLKRKSSTVTVTLTGMVLTSMKPSQSRATPGSVVLSFVHESSDGQTTPYA